MNWPDILLTLYLLVELAVKIAAIGIVPENRRPSSSTAWLLLILLLPAVGLPLFLIIGSPYVTGRRNRIQARANQMLDDGLADLPTVDPGADVPAGLGTLLTLDRRLTGLPCVTGTNHGLYDDADEFFAAAARAADAARETIKVEVYIVAWDDSTDVFFAALARAAARGVKVRLLLDHLGSRKYPHFRSLGDRLDAAGIEWYFMMPLMPLKNRWRRPDLRNHRKLIVIDGEVGFMGSQNLIDSSYLMPANIKAGRRWHDIMVELGGDIVAEIESVFDVDWYTECGQLLPSRLEQPQHAPVPVPGPDGHGNHLQLVPSGPGFTTDPNLRLFTSLISNAQQTVRICSPYFVPDESLLAAVTTAAYRGVQVELYVSEQADQFMVDHAQSSYYQALLTAGIHIYRYPRPAVLHSKFLIVDGTVGVLGSSNMDMRSFGLNYEISLLAFGGDVVTDLVRVADDYRSISSELTLEEWNRRPRTQRYLDSVFRLTSALQ